MKSLVRSAVIVIALSSTSSIGVAAPLIFDPHSIPRPNVAVVDYDVTNGRLWIYAPTDVGDGLLTGVAVKSASGMFDPSATDMNNFTGHLDRLRPELLFKVDLEGFSMVDYGPVLPAGLSSDFLLADLDVSASLKPSGKAEDLGDPAGIRLCYCLPEPSSVGLVAIGALGLIGVRRR